MRSFRHLLLLAALGCPAPALAGSAEFIVRPGPPNRVTFTSRAAIEKFEGRTDRLEGRIAVDPAALGDSVTVHLEVDLASLDTGVRKRNQHMRDNHLETARFPRAIFDGAALLTPRGGSLPSGRAVALELEGTFTIHGVSRRLRVTGEATRVDGPGGARIEFSAAFPVRLSDHAIARPEFLFLKLAEAQEVRLRGVAVAQP